MARVIPVRPADTTSEAEQVQAGLIRRADIPVRVGRAFGLSAAVIGLARRALARAHPGASPRDLAVRFVELHYGPDLADGLRRHLEQQDSSAPVS